VNDNYFIEIKKIGRDRERERERKQRRKTPGFMSGRRERDKKRNIS
jgi:hypothetical protein